jgi:hypothetical protein
MSQLIVRIDELLEDQEPPASREVAAVVAQLELLTSPSQTGTDYARRYYTALQENPESVFAHRDVVALLTYDP